MPPLLEIPQPVEDLVAEQVGTRVQLRFSAPHLTTEGTLIRRLDRIEIYGVLLPQSGSAEDFAGQARLLATLAAAQIPEGAAGLTYELPLEASHRSAHAHFALKAVNHRDMDAGFSNVASLEIADLPEPPSGLEATLTEQSIQLRWTPSPQSAFGGPAPATEGYEVYRAEADIAAPAQRLATVHDSAYQDREFVFGHRYIYIVRGIAVRGDSTARTPESNRVEIEAVDRFPPIAPQNLRAIAVPGAVELVWSPNVEADLAGYNLYRSEDGAFARMNSELLDVPLYRDASIQPGRQYRYQVRAVDRAGNEGPPSPEAATGDAASL
jgi:hypothetical protein